MPFRFPKSGRQSISMTSRLSSISAAPAYPRGSSFSPAKTKATIPENTGSSVKITPTWLAVVYCWATA